VAERAGSSGHADEEAEAEDLGVADEFLVDVGDRILLVGAGVAVEERESRSPCSSRETKARRG
jgi:hypothetical protein